MCPIFYTGDELKTKKPIRLSMKSNQIIIMNWEILYCWQHCIPFGYKRQIDKYRLKFIFPKFGEVDSTYSKFLNKILVNLFSSINIIFLIQQNYINLKILIQN